MGGVGSLSLKFIMEGVIILEYSLSCALEVLCLQRDLSKRAVLPSAPQHHRYFDRYMDGRLSPQSTKDKTLIDQS